MELVGSRGTGRACGEVLVRHRAERHDFVDVARPFLAATIDPEGVPAVNVAGQRDPKYHELEFTSRPP